MLSNAARFLMVSAAASLVALGSAPAEACQEIADEALDLAAAQTPLASGAALFTLIQKNVWGYSSSDLGVLWGSPSPSSAVYYDNAVDLIDVIGTAAGDDFTPITNIANIAAGDVLVIDATGTYSGHTAIVTGAPQQINALNPKIGTDTQWALPIVDSTTSVHGCSTIFADDRFTASAPGSCTGTFRGGVGTAFMRIYADATTGALTGHTWSVTSGGTFYAQSGTTYPVRSFVIARQQSCPLL
ncbi:hypothetical protein [Sorangium sp. Soce836]|uniref:Peptidase C51 domain-containing protein n=2 Tax=Sorangium cellulosum TaxID=56 RepID=A0A4P2QMQ9_SORCE|nr:hypothetical protein [Sorangium sp. Soce836]AUX31176.1 uncharacterized protein SOCE836_033040 [Sorangium cellulosum]WCQ90560.1 hypothetical protein NQZ70_03271 [Sorangium sp. Soce836]